MLTRTEQSILMQNRLFAGFSEAELSGLLEKMSARTSFFAKNSVLWGMGEKVENAGIVLSGRVEAGGLFVDVLMSARTVGSPVELRAAKDSRILFFSLDALLCRCAEGGGWDCAKLLSNLLEEISEKYWAMQSHIRLLAIPDGRRRLETYLQREAESTGGMVCANMTRERMAQYLGMNRSALSRLLGTMQQAGSIELRRGGIRLLRRVLPDSI